MIIHDHHTLVELSNPMEIKKQTKNFSLYFRIENGPIQNSVSIIWKCGGPQYPACVPRYEGPDWAAAPQFPAPPSPAAPEAPDSLAHGAFPAHFKPSVVCADFKPPHFPAQGEEAGTDPAANRWPPQQGSFLKP